MCMHTYQHVDKLQGMIGNLPSSFVVMGLGDQITTDGEFKICRNKLVAGIAKCSKSTWFGDVVIGKLQKQDGETTYVDFNLSDYCLIYNHFRHEP